MTQTLKQGDRGALVSLLQLGLTRAGQTPGALDGIFGAQTAAAVRAFQAANALTPDGIAVFDSPVICEYLDSIGSAPKLFPPVGPARWKALTQEALGDGILDATQPRRREIALPQDEGRQSYIALQQGKVTRALDELEKQADALGDLTTIGEITIGCALGYLDFRYANEPWRPGHPKLSAWYDRVVKLPPLAETMPVG